MAARGDKFLITGMACAACQAHVSKAISALEGVAQADVNLLSSTARVFYKDKPCPTEVIKAIQGAGYQAELLKDEGVWQASSRQRRSEAAKNEQRSLAIRCICTFIFLLPLLACSTSVMFGWPIDILSMVPEPTILWFVVFQCALALLAMLINGKIFVSGFKSLLSGAPNMDALVCMGTLASFAYSVFNLWSIDKILGLISASKLDSVAFLVETLHQSLSATYFDSCAFILFFVTLGKYLEGRAKAKTSLALEKLADLAPKTALIKKADGSEEERQVGLVSVGDTIVMKPGWTVPVDGIIVSGSSSLDESALTGESLPVVKQVGDVALSGSINCEGRFEFVASQVGADTTLAQIIRLVDEASNSKAPSARLADKVSSVFVPIVFALALITGLLWYYVPLWLDLPESVYWGTALKYAVSVLVVACPCALGLASPVAIMVGMGRAAQFGILVRNAQSLEELSAAKAVIFDKTGTLTEGKPAIIDYQTFCEDKYNRDQVLTYAMSLEQSSSHPLAVAVTKAAQDKGLSALPIDNFKEVVGGGVEALIEKQIWKIGSRGYMAKSIMSDCSSGKLQHINEYEAQGYSILYLANQKDNLVGIIVLADQLRPDSVEAVQSLHELGIKAIVLTGDRKQAAERIAEQVKADALYAEVLPSQKADVVKKYKTEAGKIILVGDGINDAPALKIADVGVAIGTGIDIAVEAADVVLMKNSLLDVVRAIELSKAVLGNIRQNLFWAFAYNVLAIPVAAGLFSGWGIELTPSLAALAMGLSSVTVVGNALRLNGFYPGLIAKVKHNRSASSEKTEAMLLQNENKKQIDAEEKVMTKILYVDGMMCEKCEMHVTRALESIEGVKVSRIEREQKIVAVELSREVTDEILREAVEKAGYKVENIVG